MGSPAGEGYLEMTPSRRTSTSPLESTRIQEEDISDTDGYLRPTFPNVEFTPIRTSRNRKSSQADSDYVSESADQVPTSFISPESYVAPDSLIGLGRTRISQRSIGSAGSNERRSSPSEPLISMSKAVD